MKHYIYTGLLVAGLSVGAMTAQAAEGIDPATECKKTTALSVDELTSFPANLTPETYPDNFQQEKNRFIFCFSNEDLDKYPKLSITQPTTITNNSPYSVVIYNVRVNSSKFTEPVTGPSITIAGTGEIILQNLQAPGLKVAIQSDGKATLLNASLSCDATLSGAAVILNSNYNRIEKSSITDCRQGVKVAGNRTLLDDVVVQKTVPAPAEGEVPQVGVVGVYVSGMGNALQGITVTGYRTGVRLSGAANLLDATADHKKTQLTGYTAPDGKVYPGSYGVYIGAEGNWVKHSVIDQFERGVVALANDIKVESNTLGGDLGAVVIGHNGETDKPYSPVTVSKNNFTTKETIIYVENSDKLAMRLLGVEWMGKHKSATDETKADMIVGKLLDQGNESTEVELVTTVDEKQTDESKYTLNYNQSCEIVAATDVIPIELATTDGAIETKNIQIGEKFFKCAANPDDPNSFFPLKLNIRAHSNTPTASVMSDNIQVAKLGDLKITVLAALPGSQMDTTDLGTNQPGATGAVMLASTDTGSLDSGGDVGGGGGGGSSTPTDLIVHDTGDNSGNSANNMTGNAATLGDGAPAMAGGGVSGAGASGGGCSLSTDVTLPHSMTSALLWLLALLPVPILVPVRVRRR